MKFPEWKDGDSHYVALQGYLDQCCHCGLVHKLNFRIEDKDGRKIPDAKLKITAWQNKKLTERARKRIKIEFRAP